MTSSDVAFLFHVSGREDLLEVVKQQEKLCVDGWAALGLAPSPGACSEPIQGKLVTPAWLIEAIEDVW